ncbi:protein kinase [Actinoplanes sp. NPDC049265]|uniref:serine/threonine-protein kinase n=1 Tax=Actinoplanes sp. NPDC049265 TaxID=3363902 RepID=UPI00371A8B7F
MAGGTRIVAGRYRLVRRLGRGGMGAVWEAHDELLGRDVAIKEIYFPGAGEGPIDPGDPLVRRALREAQAAARLRHPDIITVHDVVTEAGRPWIVMELVAGQSLADLIREAGLVSAHRAAEIGVRVLGALRAAHRQGVLHRDVKPANILLDTDRVVLTDFGIAALDDATQITVTGQMVGSPAFMPPERINGKPATAAADLWALGVTLYQAMTGRSPFHREDTQATIAAILSSRPEAPAHGGRLWAVVKGLLEKDPERRLTSDQALPLLVQAAQTADPGTPPAPRRGLSRFLPPQSRKPRPADPDRDPTAVAPPPTLAAPTSLDTPEPPTAAVFPEEAPTAAHPSAPPPGHLSAPNATHLSAPPPGHPSAPNGTYPSAPAPAQPADPTSSTDHSGSDRPTVARSSPDQAEPEHPTVPASSPDQAETVTADPGDETETAAVKPEPTAAASRSEPTATEPTLRAPVDPWAPVPSIAETVPTTAPTAFPPPGTAPAAAPIPRQPRPVPMTPAALEGNPRRPVSSRVLAAVGAAVAVAVATPVLWFAWPHGDTPDPRTENTGQGAAALAVAPSAAPAKPSAPANPLLDSCLVGSWRMISMQVKNEPMNGVEAVFTSTGGATTKIWPDGRAIDSHAGLKPLTATVKGRKWEETIRGTIKYHVETRGSTVYFSEYAGQLTFVMRREGKRQFGGDLGNGDNKGPYTCSETRMTIYGDDDSSTQSFTRVSHTP